MRALLLYIKMTAQEVDCRVAQTNSIKVLSVKLGYQGKGHTMTLDLPTRGQEKGHHPKDDHPALNRGRCRLRNR